MFIIDGGPSVIEELPVAEDSLVPHGEDQENTSVGWKGKGKVLAPEGGEVTADSEATSDLEAVDWTRYEPPEGLRDSGDIESEIVAQIIQDSIDRVKSQIIEEAERKVAAEGAKEAKRRQGQEEREQGQREEEQNDQEIKDQEKREQEQRGQVENLKGNGNLISQNPVQTDGPGQPPNSGKRFLGRKVGHLFRRKLYNGPRHGDTGQNDGIGKATSTSIGQDKSASQTTSIQGREVECVSCLDDFDPKDTVKAPCHHYCKPCFQRLIALACQNEQQWPPKCCLNDIPESTITDNVDSAQQERYRERAEEWNIPIADRIYCSHRNCSLFIPPTQISVNNKAIATCARGHYTCTICRNAKHKGVDCPQDKEVAKMVEIAQEEGWRRCYQCKRFVEHAAACRHMTCICGAEFCYLCGKRWNGVGAREQEEERVAREAAAAAEDAKEAIRQVAAFEREEARRAELRRKELARLARERQERELAERIQREVERREAVAIKFSDLRTTFAQLHETQRTIVQAHNNRLDQQLRERTDAVLAQLREIQTAERTAKSAKIEAKIKRHEDALREDYRARVAEERQIEEEYAAKLAAHWGPRKGGGAMVKAAMDALRRRMDEDYYAWRKWADAELDAHRHHLREEQAIHEELMEEKEKRLREKAGEAALALARRRTAELRWVREVVEERGRMLGELEVDEIENSEDTDVWFAEDPWEDVLDEGVIGR
ncbi:hypothetical protein GGR51DRAFT_550629 [Nemania sp. FL0031]|nr:hypothetical protein GGR51DRAFT_550629 [Nemania sp. FL0031]